MNEAKELGALAPEEMVSVQLLRAVKQALDDVHGVCAEYGCPQGATVTDWLRAKLAAPRMIAARAISPVAIEWTSPDDTGALFARQDITGAVEAVMVRLDPGHEGYDGGPIYRQTWFSIVTNGFICSATGTRLPNVTGWALAVDSSKEVSHG